MGASSSGKGTEGDGARVGLGGDLSVEKTSGKGVPEGMQAAEGVHFIETSEKQVSNRVRLAFWVKKKK